MEEAEQFKENSITLDRRLRENKLKEVFRLINSPLPEAESTFYERVKEWVTLYTYFDDRKGDYGRVRGPLGPAAPTHELSQWVPIIRQETRRYLEDLYSNLTTNGNSSAPPAAGNYEKGTRYSLVRDGKVVHLHADKDATTFFLLALGDLLAGLDDISRIRRCTCGNFFLKVRRQEYCSLECTRKAHPSDKRVQEFRKRRKKWEQERKIFVLLLEDIDRLCRKQKLQRPRSEGQIFEEAVKALSAVEKAFFHAYPYGRGAGSEDGKRLLTQAKRQIARLRKKVKGY